MTARIALATAAAALELDDDLAPLLEALAGAGVAASPAVWDDPVVAWERYDAVVLRSTWDYPTRRGEFLRWAERVAGLAALWNPVPVVAWNTDKSYLAELTAARLPVVATRFLAPGDRFEPPAFEHVVKPAISAGALHTARFAPGDPRSAALVADLQASGRTVMIQPYLDAIDPQGERGLVYIDGRFSHAFTKGAILRPGAGLVDGLFAPEVISPAEPSAAELAAAGRVHDWVTERFGVLLYARIDVVTGPDGAPVLLELELAEPSLYHACGPGSAERLAAAVVRRLGER